MVVGSGSVVEGDIAVADSVDICSDCVTIEDTPFPGVVEDVADIDGTALKASMEIAPELGPGLEVVVGTVGADLLEEMTLIPVIEPEFMGVVWLMVINALEALIEVTSGPEAESPDDG